MKKITLLLLLTFCYSLNAQVIDEGFETVNPALPANWTQTQISGTPFWQGGATQNNDASVAPRTGAGMAYFYSPNYNGDEARLETPSMDLTTLTTPLLSFYYSQEDWGGDQDELRIYYKTSAAGAWTLIPGAVYTNDTDPNWVAVDLLLPSPSADYYIGFQGYSGWGRGVTIDDVLVDEAPNCVNPGSLSTTPVNTTSSNLNWVAGGSETAWTYEYGLTGFVQGAAEEIGSGPAGSTTQLISGLTAGTSYDFYVQANCGGGDGDSGYAGPFTWVQPLAGDSCQTAFAGTLEADGGCGTGITLDFTGAISNINTSCDTFNNYGRWITVTTDANGTLRVNADSPVFMALYDGCEAADIACFNTDISPSQEFVGLAANTQHYLYFWQEGQASTAMVDICFESFPPDPAPDCAEEPITPANGATGVTTGVITLNWTAPSAGPAPTSYNIYAGTAPGVLGLVTNVVAPATTVDVNVWEPGITIYWNAVPLNGATEAVSCAEWSFTMEDPVGNDDCGDATLLTPSASGAIVWQAATTLASSASGETPIPTCSTFGSGRDVWFEVRIPDSGELIVETRSVGGSALTDTAMAIYTGACGGGLVEIACDDDSSTDGNFSLIDATGLAPIGTLLRVRVFEWNNTTREAGPRSNERRLQGDFEIAAHASDPTLGTTDFDTNQLFTYFPNPVNNILTIKAQNEIQNIGIYNMLGQEVLRTSPNTVTNEIDMSAFQSGAYFIKVMVQNTTETIRIIKN